MGGGISSQCEAVGNLPLPPVLPTLSLGGLVKWNHYHMVKGIAFCEFPKEQSLVKCKVDLESGTGNILSVRPPI